MKIAPIVILAAALMAGCTSVNVTPLKATDNKHVCIERNEKVVIEEFIPVLVNGFEDHGFKTTVYDGATPAGCGTVLTYTATRKWDMAPYMNNAQLWLRDRQGNRVGHAQYHLKGGGGLALNKWASVESKMKPVIDQLLAGH